MSTSIHVLGVLPAAITTGDCPSGTHEFLCDDIRQLVISFLGNSISSIGLEAGTTNSSTLSTIVHASSHDQQQHRHNKFPLLRSSLLDHKKTSHALRKQPPSPFKTISTCMEVNPCMNLPSCKTINPFSLKSKTRTTCRGQQQPTNSTTTTGRDDDLLTVQLLSHSWNMSFHRTCLEATHIVVRRAIICRHRCLASSGKKKEKKTEQTIANEMVEEEEALLYRDVADLATDQRLFLEAHREEVRQLDAAVTVWKAATASLDVLDKRSFRELKMFTRPPQMVMVVMEAVCILFGEKPEWATSKKFLSDSSSFLDKLLRFPKDEISPTTLKKIQKYTSDPSFDPNVVRRSSIACEGLCAWVRALESYTQVGHTISTKNTQLKTQIALAQEIIALADLLLSTRKARPLVQSEELTLPTAGLEQNQMSLKLTEVDSAVAETSILPDFSG